MRNSRSSRTTLRDVARAAGVSIASASRVLTGSSIVSTELQARIMAAAARLGYQTNFAARALALQRSGLVGIVLGSVADFMLANMLQAAQGALAAQGYGALITCRDAPAEFGRIPNRTLSARGVEGILYLGVSPGASEVEALANDGVPWVAVADGQFRDGMRFDNGQARGAELACRYLLDLGHQRFGVMSPHGAGTREGVAKALQGTAASLVAEELPGDGDSNSVRTAVNRLLDERNSLSAIVCARDEDALAVVRECSIRGIAVPGECSVVGYGDAWFARYALPALTTVRVSAAEIGCRSAEALLQSISGTEPQPYAPSVKLIIRETTGPATL